eukprot:m.56201 g.56201  ORF g.56201 m.56201 type:complete len:320 (-) comp22204_c0_seq1:33-992(-)
MPNTIWKSEAPNQTQPFQTHAHNRAIYGSDTLSPRELSVPRKNPVNVAGLQQKIKYRPTTSVVRSCGPLAQAKKLELLLEDMLPESDEASIRLFFTVRKQDIQGVEAAMAEGADVDYAHPKYNTMTSLMNACCENWMEGVELLVTRYNANVNLGNAKGDTPLMKAIIHKHIEMVALLIQKGANVHAVSEFGCTPSSYAIQTGVTKICELVENEKQRQIDEKEAKAEMRRTSEHLAKNPPIPEEEQVRRSLERTQLRIKTEESEIRDFLESRKLSGAWYKLREQQVTSMQVLLDLTMDDMLSIGITENDANQIAEALESA